MTVNQQRSSRAGVNPTGQVPLRQEATDNPLLAEIGESAAADLARRCWAGLDAPSAPPRIPSDPRLVKTHHDLYFVRAMIADR
jgi:hypothetical protein